MKTAQIALLFFASLAAAPASGQGSFFKIIERPYTRLFQRVASFPDGGVVVGDRLSEGPTLSAKNGFYLARFGACGEVVWTKYFNPPGDKLLLDDIEINEAGDIFVMGTDLNGSLETLFLMKLDGQGEVVEYRHFPGTWDEMFTYSLDLLDGRLMISGLLFYPGPPKTGAVFLFDENLDPIWAREYEPFVAYNESILTSDGGVLAISGHLILKLGNAGELEWSVQVGPSTVPNFSAPVEIEEGYVFEMRQNGFSHLFLVKKDGSPGWQTSEFPSGTTVDGLHVLPGGDAQLFYLSPQGTGNLPARLRVSPSGEISQQQRLVVDYPLRASFMYPTLAADGTVHLFGQANSDFMTEAYHFDFLARFPLDGPTGDCFFWENMNDTQLNSVALPVVALPVTVSDAPIMVVERPVFSPGAIDFLENEICPPTSSHSVNRRDTLLACDENWPITLPSPEYIWSDGSAENPRLLNAPGLYRASMIDCRDTTSLEFFLEKKTCECAVFLPTAISPNGDGINDELRPFSNCEIRSLHLEVFDRWGGQVFLSTESDEFWDGNVRSEKAAGGVYAVVVRYLIVDEQGGEHEGSMVQDLVLVR